MHVSVADLAGEFNITPAAIHQYIKTGEIPPELVGHNGRVKTVDAEGFLALVIAGTVIKRAGRRRAAAENLAPCVRSPAESPSRPVKGTTQAVHVARRVKPLVSEGSITTVTVKPGVNGVEPGRAAQSYEPHEPYRFSPAMKSGTASRSDIFANVKAYTDYLATLRRDRASMS